MTRIAQRWSHGGSAGHTALFYASEVEYVEGVRDFIERAATGGSLVIVAVPKAGLKRLRPALVGCLEHVELVDMAELGTNPARIIPAITAAADTHGRQPLYFVERAGLGGSLRGRGRRGTVSRGHSRLRVHLRRRRDPVSL